jgi:cytochrome c-type biogenesis protein CcmH
LVSFSFWILAALLILVTLAVILWPLLRQPRAGTIATQTALLREQLDALKSAHASGLIDDASFQSRQQALSATALALIDTPSNAPPPSTLTARATALILVLLIPLTTLWLYEKIGTPHALAFAGINTSAAPDAAGGASTSNAPDLAKAADSLAAKMKDNPEDGQGWVLLARTYRAIERFPEASSAYAKALPLIDDDADVLAEAAEALGLSSSPRSLAGEPEALVDRALKVQPDNQNALFLKGLARAQANDPETAETIWEKLLTLMEPGTPAQSAVVEQLNVVRRQLGKEPQALPAMPTGTPAVATAPAASAGPAEGTTAAGIDVNVSIAPELAARIQPSDVLFVFARAEAGPPAPLAIQRLAASELPRTIRLDESMGMIAGMSLAQFPRVIIGARVSKSGNAQASPGDLEGLSVALDWRAAGKVDIVISTVK